MIQPDLTMHQAGGNVEEATEKLFMVMELRSVSVSEEERREKAKEDERWSPSRAVSDVF